MKTSKYATTPAPKRDRRTMILGEDRPAKIDRVKEERARCAACVPTNWCDSLLTGPHAVLIHRKGSYTGADIERLLLAIKKRITG